jgi:RHS repeat-associated protein
MDDKPVAVYRGGQLYYIETDHLGTPRKVVDSTTLATVWEWPLVDNWFGTQQPNQDADGNGVVLELNLRFPGQYFDAETGLHYNYFRDYDATTGRYLQSDPIGLRGGPNTYAYVASGPLRRIDPQGLDFWLEGSVEGEGGHPFHRSVCVGERGTSNRFCISFGVAEEDCLMGCKGEVYPDESAEGPLIEHRESSASVDSVIKATMISHVGDPGTYYVYGNNCRDYSGEYFLGLDSMFGEGFLGAGKGGKPYWGVPP